jgi:hypothetical protein
MAGAAERNCWTGMAWGRGVTHLSLVDESRLAPWHPHQGRKAELGLLLNTPQIFTHAETGTALQTRRAHAEAPVASAVGSEAAGVAAKVLDMAASLQAGDAVSCKCFMMPLSARLGPGHNRKVAAAEANWPHLSRIWDMGYGIDSNLSNMAVELTGCKF